MTNTPQFQNQSTLSDLFTVVYVMVDDYLKSSVEVGRFVLPSAPNQKGGYAEWILRKRTLGRSSLSNLPAPVTTTWQASSA